MAKQESEVPPTGRPKSPGDGVARTGDQLLALLRAHRIATGLSQFNMEVDSGFHHGYVNRIENPYSKYGRRVVTKLFDKWLSVLGLGIALVPLDERGRPIDARTIYNPQAAAEARLAQKRLRRAGPEAGPPVA